MSHDSCTHVATSSSDPTERAACPPTGGVQSTGSVIDCGGADTEAPDTAVVRNVAEATHGNGSGRSKGN